MASTFVTAVVATVLGIVIGVVGLAAVTPALSPSAGTVADETEAGQPSLYGNR
ncbi:MAG TPA: hypothetical protein VF163_18375 [Micromonosporaceae bacterium]